MIKLNEKYIQKKIIVFYNFKDTDTIYIKKIYLKNIIY